MKVPDTLEGLLDVMRAKGCATFAFEASGIGGSPVKVSGSFGEAPRAPVGGRVSTISPEPAAAAPRVSDIELALNPPVLDEIEEAAYPSEALDPEAPRVSAPAGAPDPDASA